MAEQLAAVVGDVEVCNPEHPTLDLWVCLYYAHGNWDILRRDNDEDTVRKSAKGCADRGYPTRVFHVRDA